MFGIISPIITSSYKISAGDTIEIKFIAPEYGNKTVDMKVLQVSTQYSNPSFYMTETYLESFDIDFKPTSLFVEVNNTTDLVSIRNYFEQDHRVDAIADKSDLKKTAEYTLKQNNFVFVMFIICAVVLSFGAIYTISSINIYERNRELATLKVLGYQRNKINRLIFFENMIITTFAVIVALPISGYVYFIVVNALSSTHQQIPSQLNILIIVVSAIVAYLLTMLSSLILRRKVTNINMMESLKSME